jgi:transglutaminase-like putative cysteine protease
MRWTLLMVAILLLGSSRLPGQARDSTPPPVDIVRLATSVAGQGSALERTGRLVYWINDSLKWSYTDYVRRSPPEILARRQGNCADLASVLHMMLDSMGIRSRWIREINVQPRRHPIARRLLKGWWSARESPTPYSVSSTTTTCGSRCGTERPGFRPTLPTGWWGTTSGFPPGSPWPTGHCLA